MSQNLRKEALTKTAQLLKVSITKMNTKVRKSVIIAGVLFLCLLLLGSFLTSSAVLAQEPIKKSGELVGGHSDSIPIQLKLGEVVQGKIIASNEPLRVTIDDPSGKEVENYGQVTHRSFSYQARIEGEHYIVITNPNTITVRKRGYTLSYTILPASSFPPPPAPEGPNLTPWVIIGSIWVTAFGLIIFFIAKEKY
ncbi:hypothetical protein KKA69_04695 [Patescibacteria group bacterium]|nr:hypothetical protein [Patescibacteria group bacterium]